MKLFRGGEEEKEELFTKNNDVADTLIIGSDGKEVTEMETLEETKLLKL